MFDLNTFSEAIGTLNGGGTVTIPSGAALTVSPSAATCSYGGNVSGTGSLSKAGAGKLVLTGTNSHTGMTFISGRCKWTASNPAASR